MIVKIVKIYLGLSLVLLWAVWGQFIFRQFLGLAYISQDLQAPSYVVGTNYRVLIYCTCHFQGGFLCFSVFCALVCLVSDFCPDTRGRWWTHFQAHCSVTPWGGRDAPFEDNECLMSSAGIQKLFRGIYSAFKRSFDEFMGEKVVSPSYSSTILGPPLFSIY